jgi:hypothetical protein
LVAFVAEIQLQVFLFQRSLKRTCQVSFAPFFCRKPKLRKRNKHEFVVKRGGLGAFVAKNSTASFFVPKVAKTDLPGEFRTALPSKTETPKTQQTRVLGQTGWIGSVHCEKFNGKFFVPRVAKTDLPVEFCSVLQSKTETLKMQQT